MTKPDCYKCKHRGEVPGSAHSKCKHPAVKNSGILDDPIITLLTLRGGEFDFKIPGIEVEGHPNGIKGGWFAWPLNFDPVWLVSCNGFEEV